MENSKNSKHSNAVVFITIFKKRTTIFRSVQSSSSIQAAEISLKKFLAFQIEATIFKMAVWPLLYSFLFFASPFLYWIEFHFDAAKLKKQTVFSYAVQYLVRLVESWSKEKAKVLCCKSSNSHFVVVVFLGIIKEFPNEDIKSKWKVNLVLMFYFLTTTQSSLQYVLHAFFSFFFFLQFIPSYKIRERLILAPF